MLSCIMMTFFDCNVWALVLESLLLALHITKSMWNAHRINVVNVNLNMPKGHRTPYRFSVGYYPLSSCQWPGPGNLARPMVPSWPCRPALLAGRGTALAFSLRIHSPPSSKLDRQHHHGRSQQQESQQESRKTCSPGPRADPDHP